MAMLRQGLVERANLSGGGGGTPSIGGGITGGTTGSVLFVGPSATIAQDNANFFWDDTNNRLLLSAETITSSSATAFAVGLNGVTNPAFLVDASTASSATGVRVKSAAAGGGSTLTAISSASDEAITLTSKGSANTTINAGNSIVLSIGGSTTGFISQTSMAYLLLNRNFSSNTGYGFQGCSASSMPSSAETLSFLLNLAQTLQHSAGTITLQRDVLIMPSTHSFTSASTITHAASFSIDSTPTAGTNATFTNASALHIPTKVLVNTTNGHSIYAVAPTGATNNYAAYLDGAVTATGNLAARQLTLTGQASPTYSAGTLAYDTGDECPTFFCNDSNVSLQIGQEEWIMVINNTGSTIANGSVVYLNGASAGRPTIALAQANAGSTTIGAGLATQSIANGATGRVTCLGLVRGVDTSAFTAGQAVYISSSVAGGLTATAPTSPNYRYRVGIVGVSNASTGTIHVTPSTASLGNGTANQLSGINAAGTAQEYKNPGANVTGQISFRIDGGGSTITTGAKKLYQRMAYAGTITGWEIVGDQSGSIVFDIWKDTYANFPPTVADTITASAKPTVTTAQKATSTTLTAWTTSFAAGDYLEINVDSVTSMTLAILNLTVTRT